MSLPVLPDDPASREATIRSEVLDTLAAHGGERIIAGPPMERLVDELTAKILRLLPAC